MRLVNLFKAEWMGLTSLGISYVVYVISKQEKGLMKLMGRLLALAIVALTILYGVIVIKGKLASLADAPVHNAIKVCAVIQK